MVLSSDKYLTLSKGKKNAEALDVLLPAFKATALPCQSMTGDPLEPPFVPEAACVPRQEKQKDYLTYNISIKNIIEQETFTSLSKENKVVDKDTALWKKLSNFNRHSY